SRGGLGGDGVEAPDRREHHAAPGLPLEGGGASKLRRRHAASCARALFHGAAEWSLVLACCCAPAPAFATSPYDKTFDDVMSRYHLPGLALGVIEDGKVTYARTGGELVAGSG